MRTVQPYDRASRSSIKPLATILEMPIFWKSYAMIRKQYLAIALALSALGITVLPAGISTAYAAGETATATPNPTEAVSVEVGTPLKAAQELYNQKKYKEALDKLNEITAPNKTPYETYTI
jgi:hypothetical protein